MPKIVHNMMFIETPNLKEEWNYNKNIEIKRKFVENTLRGNFEFLQFKLNRKQIELIRKNQ